MLYHLNSGDIGEFPKSVELGIGPNVPKDPEHLAPLLDLRKCIGVEKAWRTACS